MMKPSTALPGRGNATTKFSNTRPQRGKAMIERGSRATECPNANRAQRNRPRVAQTQDFDDALESHPQDEPIREQRRGLGLEPRSRPARPPAVATTKSVRPPSRRIPASHAPTGT
jgi:hypothetical protein